MMPGQRHFPFAASTAANVTSRLCATDIRRGIPIGNT